MKESEDQKISKEALIDLVGRAKRGNTQAFQELYDLYLTPIYRFIYISAHDRDEAEDLTQAVFVKAWSAIADYKEEGKPFSAWLYRIAKNLLIDASRKKRSVSLEDIAPAEEPHDDSVDPHVALDQKEAMRTALLAFKELTDEQREVLTLRFIEEKEYREIAITLEKSEATVRQLQHRALVALRKILKPEAV
jgi:RNA polymerase sigma-70 factor, ECF subfamily